MTYKERKNYLFYVSIAFLVGAVFYACLAYLGLFLFNDSSLDLPIKTRIINFVLATFVGGYLICSILSGILQFIKFISNQTRLIKVLAIVFFFLIFQIIVLYGFFSTLPYFIYNIFQVKNRRVQIDK